MFYFLGAKECLNILFRFSASMAETAPSDLSEMQKIYASHWIPKNLFNRMDHKKPVDLIDFEDVESFWGLRIHENLFSREAYPPKKHQYQPLENLHSHLENLLNENENFRSIFSSYIRFITSDYRDDLESGTRSTRLGIITVNQRYDFTYSDFSEMCIHELCHTILFVDEALRPYYTSEEYLILNFQSAIRKGKCPLRPAFHSLIVCAEIIFYRHHTSQFHIQNKIHGTSSDLCKQLMKSIHDFESHPEALSPYGLTLIENIKNKLNFILNEEQRQGEIYEC